MRLYHCTTEKRMEKIIRDKKLKTECPRFFYKRTKWTRCNNARICLSFQRANMCSIFWELSFISGQVYKVISSSI